MNNASMRADAGYGALKNYVLKHTGLSYYRDKDEDFATRLSRRLHARGVSNCDGYLRLLTGPDGGGPEMDRLVGELTIGETYFFRQREHFDLLRQTILPDLIRRNQATRRLRIWSAGCATGAEPYSISLLLKLDLRSQLAGWDVFILATDINVEFLSQGEQAAFAGWALRGVPDELKMRCFLQEGKFWRLRPEFQEGVVFEYDNLAKDAHCRNDQPFDLILCRNVLIYFSRDQANSVIGRFYHCLPAGGWLLVGYAEPNMEMFREFETVSTPDATAYRKPAGDTQGHAPETNWQPFVWDGQSGAGGLGQLISPVLKPTAAISAPGREPAELVPTVEDVRTLADSGHWDAARALCHKLLQAEPLNPATQFVSALIQEHCGANSEARTAFQRAIYLNRQFALAHYHLGTSLERDGQQELANRAFRNALDIVTALPEDEPLPYGDSITAGELRDLAMLRLEGVSR
jgi:chemotaxis protein methyltransferase CheR